MSDRGMMKWAPYKSLVEQADCLEEMRYKKNKISKPKVSSDKAEEINEILINCVGKKLLITFFYNGYIYKIESIVKKLDVYNKKIVIEEGKINLLDILDLAVI